MRACVRACVRAWVGCVGRTSLNTNHSLYSSKSTNVFISLHEPMSTKSLKSVSAIVVVVAAASSLRRCRSIAVSCVDGWRSSAFVAIILEHLSSFIVRCVVQMFIAFCFRLVVANKCHKRRGVRWSRCIA